MKMKRIKPFRVWLLPAALLAVVVAGPARAPAPPEPPVSAAGRFGAFLAGRHAQEDRDYAAAARFFTQALRFDPDSPELLSRTFLMQAYEGWFAEARPLAARELRLDATDSVADLVLLIDRVKAGDKTAALARAEALPADGLYRYARPPAVAWLRMAGGDLAGAAAALQGLDRFDGLAPLKYFQLGLLYDFAGQPAAAEENFKKTVEETGQINWRVTDAMANFYERHHRPDEAAAIYRRFSKDNAGSELAESVLTGKSGDGPHPIILSAQDGLAEAFFDLASVVNRPETVDLALFYSRCALALRPQLEVAQLLLSDILAGADKTEESVAVLRQIPAGSRYFWSAQLRIAADLDTLDRSDEAIGMLRHMAAKEPTRATAQMQLGDLFREKKRFVEAADAYSEAIRRLRAAGAPERWSLFYSRGISLERAGQWQKAEADLLHALKLKPDQPLVLNYLGYSWIDRGAHLRRGLQMIEKAVDLRPEDGYIVDSLGWAHYRLGDYHNAVQYLEKAVELVPNDPTINDHLGDAYWQTGRLIEARYQWRRALQFGPEKDEVKPIESKLVRGMPAPAARANGG
jgi:tetratricopeptide (TPR) repeat protein